MVLLRRLGRVSTAPVGVVAGQRLFDGWRPVIFGGSATPASVNIRVWVAVSLLICCSRPAGPARVTWWIRPSSRLMVRLLVLLMVPLGSVVLVRRHLPASKWSARWTNDLRRVGHRHAMNGTWNYTLHHHDDALSIGRAPHASTGVR